MKNRELSGERVTFTAPSGGVTSGVPVRIGRLIVIPVASAAQGLPFEGVTQGIFTLPKATGQAWTEGAVVYWANGAGNFTTTASTNQLAGVAVAAAASGDTTGRIRLNGIAALDS